jgi:hypothetical protein
MRNLIESVTIFDEWHGSLAVKEVFASASRFSLAIRFEKDVFKDSFVRGKG